MMKCPRVPTGRYTKAMDVNPSLWRWLVALPGAGWVSDVMMSSGARLANEKAYEIRVLHSSI